MNFLKGCHPFCIKKAAQTGNLAYGSWLMAHSSWLIARGSQLLACSVLYHHQLTGINTIRGIDAIFT